jgi:RNA polymerase sigma factor (sigma-70 family)
MRTLLPHLRELVSRTSSQAADRELLRRFSAERDEAAFTEIVRRHGPMLLRVCQRALHNGHDAEDVCQAAFLLLAQKATAIRWHDSVAGWLFQTAYRLSLKARVAGSRRAHHEARARPARQADPVAELTVGELQAALDEELSRLPGKYRAPIVLCCLEGRSRDEAASCLGWRLATVKDRLEQGRQRLRVRLARRGMLLGTALTSAWLLEGAPAAGLSPQATARAALLLATGQATLAGLLSARVAALAKGVTRTVLLRRVTMVAAGLALVLGAAGVTMPAEEAPPTRAQTAPPARHGAGPVQPEALVLGRHRGQ